MNRNRIIYWTSTVFVAAMMLFSAVGYFTNAELKAVFVHLGYPGYLRIELAVFKMLGALVLVIPMVPAKIKEFAYFGFALTFISAIIAIVSIGDPMSATHIPLILLGLLSVSYIFKNKPGRPQRSF